MNLNELKKLLGAGTLTKTLGPVLEQEKDLKKIHRAAKSLGYTRSAVNHALRKNGIKQGRGSNQ
jgi:hypothetical protein